MPDDPTARYGGPQSSAPSPAPIEMASEPFDVTPAPDPPADVLPTRRGSRSRRIVLAALLAVGLAGSTALGLAAWRVAEQKDAVLGTPAQVGELRRDDSPRAATTADYLRTALAAKVDLDDVVGAVYSDPGRAQRAVLFFGGTTLLWTPERDLDTVLELVSDETGAVTDLRAVAPGGLGGVMKCGAVDAEGARMAVCGWADHGSIAVALFPERQPAESAELLRRMRDAAQQRR